MNSPLTKALYRWVHAGKALIGEVRIVPMADGAFRLLHHADSENGNLEIFSDPRDAREIATNDEQGVYRPLKSAPNLRRGWQLDLSDIAALQLALDFLYPAALGMALASEEGTLVAVHFRDTVSRQSGMYRVTGLISDEDADELVSAACKSDGGCLRSILWRISDSRAVTGLPVEKLDPARAQASPDKPAISLLCREICCHVIAAARERVKAAMKARDTTV